MCPMNQETNTPMASTASDESLRFTVVDNILVCNVYIDAGDNYFGRLSKAIASILAREPYHGVVLDMSNLPLLDRFAYPAISKLVSIISLMGRCCVISGISPGVAAFLAESDIEVENLVTAGHTDKALDKIRSLISSEQQNNPGSDKESQKPAEADVPLDESEPV